MPYQAIAFDMDGTLLTSQRTILPETVAVLEKIKAKGIPVMLVTGRHHSVVYPYYHQLGLDTPVVCCNGTYLYDFAKQQAINAHPMSQAQARSLLEQVNEYGIHTLIYTDSVMTYEVLDDHLAGLFTWVDTVPAEIRPQIRQVDSFLDVIASAKQIYKFATSSHDIPALTAFSKAVEARGDMECEWSWVNRADIALKGNSKGNGLRYWADSQDIPMSRIVAFGDSYNDITLLESCGLGIAMGNADDAVKARANRVAGDNNGPTIAHILTELFL